MKREYKKANDGSLIVERYEVTEEGRKVIQVCFGNVIEKQDKKPEEIEAEVEDKKNELLTKMAKYLVDNGYLKFEVINHAQDLVGVTGSIFVGMDI